MLKHTLVLGASLKSNRYSNIAIKKLRTHGHPVTALGLLEGRVEDVPVQVFNSAFLPTEHVDEKIIEAIPSSAQFKGLSANEDHIDKYDTITLYLNPRRQSDYYELIISMKPKRVLFNPGTENPEFYPLLKEHNIAYEEACTLVLLSTNQY